MRRNGALVAGGVVLALLLGGGFVANALTVRDKAGTAVSIDPVVVTPDPSLPDPTTPAPPPEPVPTADPVPPAPPQDIDDDDDDVDDVDDVDDDIDD